MKKVNVKLYATIDKLIKKLTKIQSQMKEDLINGAEKSFENYANIKIVECSRKSWSKEIQQELDEYAKSKGYEKTETKYKRIDIDNINEEADTIINEVVNMLDNSNNKVVAKVASKVASIK